jgi:hypothetical protein
LLRQLSIHCGHYDWRYADDMAVVRWTNLICGAALVIAAVGFLVFLPDNVSEYAREPEDVWLSGFWVGLLGLLAALCFANARQSSRPEGFSWRTLANFVAFIALAGLFVIGRDDPALPPLLALCALGPLAALVGAWRHSQVTQP